MEFRPSPASIPLPLSNAPSPALPSQEVPPRSQTLSTLLPSDVKDLQNLRQFDLAALRRAMEDDGASSVGARSTADEEDDYRAELEEEPQQAQEVPVSSSTVPTGDSLFQALRSPTLEPIPLASTSTPPVEQANLGDPNTESSGELTRIMARYPMIIAGPGSAPHKPPVRAMSHESFISNLRRASVGTSEGAQEEGSGTAGLPSSGSRYSNEEPAEPLYAPMEDIPEDVSASSATISGYGEVIRSTIHESTPVQRNVYPESPSPQPGSSRRRRYEASPDPQKSPRSPPPRKSRLSASMAPVPSTSYPQPNAYDDFMAAARRNEEESKVLDDRIADARQEVDDLERQCEEMRQMMLSIGMQPPVMSENESDRSVRSPEHAPVQPQRRKRPPDHVRRGAPSAQPNPAPQTRTVSYHHMNGEHRRPNPSTRTTSDSSREALRRVSQKLSLPMSALTGGESQTSRSPNPYEPQSLDDVARAMDFLRSVDSLIWKGRRESGRMSGRAGDSVFGEENVQALRERLGLWERAVRSKR